MMIGYSWIGKKIYIFMAPEVFIISPHLSGASCVSSTFSDMALLVSSLIFLYQKSKHSLEQRSKVTSYIRAMALTLIAFMRMMIAGEV